MMMSRHLNGVAVGWKCLIKSLVIIKDSNTKVSFIRTLLEHSIQFLSSTTRENGKGLKGENIGQSFQVLWTRYILKIPKILTWTPFPKKKSFDIVILVYKRCCCFSIKCQICVSIDTGDPNT